MLFSPQAVEDIVRSFEQLLDYRVIFSREGELDEVTLILETREAAEVDSDLLNELEVALKLKTKLRVQIEFCAQGTLPTEEIKTRRVIDTRQLKP